MIQPARTCLVVLVALATLTAHCGRKGDLIPPELAAPETVRELSARVTPEGILLRWKRPRKTVGGRSLDDLGAFVVERSAEGGPFERIATVPVTDRERFRRAARFTHLDPAPGSAAGGLRYRVIALTTDGYNSSPSPPVEVRAPARSGTNR